MKNRGWLIAGFILLALLVVLLYQLRTVVVPLVIALLFAYLLDPVTDYLEERGASRTLAVGTVFASFFMAVATMLLLLVPALVGEVAQIKAALPEYAASVGRLVPEKLLQMVGLSADGGVEELMQRGLTLAEEISFDVAGDVLLFVSQAFSSTLSLVVALLGYCIIPVYLFYLLKDFDVLRAKVMTLFPTTTAERVVTVARDVDQVVSAFVRGQLTVCAILAILYSVGLLVIGVDLAIMIGLCSGAAFIIPYLGTIIGVVAGATMALMKFQDVIHPLAVVGWFLVVQALEGIVISPKIVGDRVGLHPLATIIAVLVCGELFGFWGLIIGVPLFATIAVLLRYLIAWYRETVLEPLEGTDGSR